MTFFLKDFAARGDPLPAFRQSRTEIRIASGVYVEPGRLLAVWMPFAVVLTVGIHLIRVGFPHCTIRVLCLTGVFTLIVFLCVQFVPVIADIRLGNPGRSSITTWRDTATLFGHDLYNVRGTRIATEYAKQYTFGWPHPVVTLYIPFTDSNNLQPFPNFSLASFDDPAWWTPRMSSAMVRVIPGVYINWLMSLGCWIALWAAALYPIAIIRRLTFKARKPHHCTACQYDVTGLELCPECGLRVENTVLQ
ncbi:MAG: hypothetical protein H6815_03395 [Phycisphaeraceae bacterium]|nr:hypothetical protein [Phycisphaerales bacterium]MCB9859472.1 hypothetical protein [Phycisphaeraceae bacterium]